MGKSHRFFPPWIMRAWRNSLISINVVLVGPEAESPQNKVLAWCRALAAPAVFFATGLALMLWASDTFWLGAYIAAVGCLLMFVDLFLVTRKEGTSTKSLALFLVALPVSLVGWLMFRTAPLNIIIVSPPSDYEPGNQVYGMTWKKEYSAVDITLTNATDREYVNLDAWITTDLWIADHGMLDGINHCVVTAELPEGGITAATMTMVDSLGHKRTVPVFSGVGVRSTINRVRCDTVAPHSSVELMFALVADIFDSRRAIPKWAVVNASYESGNRIHGGVPLGKCFSSPCHISPIEKIHELRPFPFPLQ